MLVRGMGDQRIGIADQLLQDQHHTQQGQRQHVGIDQRLGRREITDGPRHGRHDGHHLGAARQQAHQPVAIACRHAFGILQGHLPGHELAQAEQDQRGQHKNGKTQHHAAFGRYVTDFGQKSNSILPHDQEGQRGAVIARLGPAFGLDLKRRFGQPAWKQPANQPPRAQHDRGPDRQDTDDLRPANADKTRGEQRLGQHVDAQHRDRHLGQRDQEPPDIPATMPAFVKTRAQTGGPTASPQHKHQPDDRQHQRDRQILERRIALRGGFPGIQNLGTQIAERAQKRLEPLGPQNRIERAGPQRQERIGLAFANDPVNFRNDPVRAGESLFRGQNRRLQAGQLLCQLAAARRDLLGFGRTFGHRAEGLDLRADRPDPVAVG